MAELRRRCFGFAAEAFRFRILIYCIKKMQPRFIIDHLTSKRVIVFSGLHLLHQFFKQIVSECAV